MRRDVKYWLATGVAAVLFTAVAAGQTLRLKLSDDSAATLQAADLALAAVAVTMLGVIIQQRRFKEGLRYIWHHPAWKWSALFLGWAVLSLAINAPRYDSHDLLLAGGYLARLAAIFSVAWAVGFLFADTERYIFHKYFMGAGIALLLLGYLQFIFINDFGFMAQYGWDPHIGRMLSTFYDPNYFGVYLALLMCVALAGVFGGGARKRAYLGLFVFAWVGLFLAYSRSAWVAATIAVVGLAFTRSKKLSLVLLAIFVIALLVPNRLSDRFADSRNLANQSNYTNKPDKDGNLCDGISTADGCDPSGSARVVSIKQGIDLASDNWLIGVGYNAYGPAQVKQGNYLPATLNVHSSSGSDSSLINLWATTGVIGLGLFLAWLASTGWQLHKASRRQQRDWLAAALGWFGLAWVAVSFLNNALLYPSILIFWIVLTAVVIGHPQATKRQRA